ncbi:MAG TPA: polysaccharide deacetylase family protein [Opitutaceae bacterium]|nr:polysaccharide deacetylase family protein [Opitutaceae bacterium]
MSLGFSICFMVGKLAAVALWCHGGYTFWGAALFFGADLLMVYALLVPSAQGLVRVFTRFETREREVWLTIDDGPDPEDTPRILDALDQFGARGTFFFIGEKAEKYPEWVVAVVQRGHEVAHHTHTHPDASFWCASPRRLAKELDLALTALAPARPRAFRSPVGIKHPLLSWALRRRNLVYVGWTLRSWDSTAQSVQQVVDQVMPRVRPGSILLFHEGPRLQPGIRVHALKEVLRHLQAQGFRCVIPETRHLR